MSDMKLNKINNHLISEFKDGLKDNLYALILDGSVAFNESQDHWSDVDLVLVVEDMNLVIKQKIAQIKEGLESQYNKHFGINVILKSEFIKPKKSTISLDGKTLQALLELNVFPQRLIYIKDAANEFYVPTKKEIKEYSLSNIFMFLLRSRKELTSKEIKTVNEYSKAAKKEIRAAFIITKLAIQYSSFYICKNKTDLIKKAKELFIDYNFQILEDNVTVVKNWQDKKTKSQLIKILESNNKFIEEFSRYFINKIKA